MGLFSLLFDNVIRALCFPVSLGTQIGYNTRAAWDEKSFFIERSRVFYFSKMECSPRVARGVIAPLSIMHAPLRRALLFELRISKKEHNARENYGGCVLFEIRIRNLPPAVLPLVLQLPFNYIIKKSIVFTLT